VSWSAIPEKEGSADAQERMGCCRYVYGYSATASCSGQLPPGLPVPPINFATLHSYGSSGIVDIRHMALGGAHVADDRDGWHGNPAGMIAATKPAVEVHNLWARSARFRT